MPNKALLILCYSSTFLSSQFLIPKKSIPGLKDTVGGAPVHRNYSFLCTMYSLQGNCTCEKLTRSLDWRLLYRRQFLRSKDLGQEDDDAGLVEGAQDGLKRRKNPRIREHLISPCSYIFRHKKRLYVCLQFCFVFLFLHFKGWIISWMKVK